MSEVSQESVRIRRPDDPDAYRSVPSDPEVRRRVRAAAERTLAKEERRRPLRREDLEARGLRVLAAEGLDEDLLGFAMVAVDNAFWRDQFAATPFGRRVLLLPHCLRAAARCRGAYDGAKLLCAGCGACVIADLKREAEALGYTVLVAEGTPPVVEVVLRGDWGAVLGVACTESLDKAFEKVSALGVPHAAVPLLKDGCVDTVAELDELRDWLRLRTDDSPEPTQAFYPLLREAGRLFEANALDPMLKRAGAATTADATAALARDWLRRGGKRFRPFLTLAAWAAMGVGASAFRQGETPPEIPEPVRRIAVAMEALHKASLVHDDIEDDDAYRYGEETLHRRHGVPIALNVGDYLIGLGYRLVAAAKCCLGAAAVADILERLAEAHLRLCRGQGEELARTGDANGPLTPADALRIYALKTAPAFETALYAGARSAGSFMLSKSLRLLCRHLGVAYQARNDLKDWREDPADKRIAGQDALAARPTIVRAFALEALSEEARRQLAAVTTRGGDPLETLGEVRGLFEECGAFARTEELVAKERRRAGELAQGLESEALRELFDFVIRVMLG